MLAGNGRAPKYVFRDCDHVFRPICFIFGHMIGMARARVVMEPDFRILMLAGNGRAPKYVFRDCDHVFRPICFKFGGYMGMV